MMKIISLSCQALKWIISHLEREKEQLKSLTFDYVCSLTLQKVSLLPLIGGGM